ncbi:smoothelin, like [Pseudochaenichthys georgianus]|uniref:smoothelin, like n=1 Tax=Pseudochaenichthys georgianus TaxID=52239 RepID=UPI00146E3EE5|nr:smoothelin, like [Pseudochaenichthys georgianus]XP_033952605.1 smoothelin, like [Pseudochaenichthys georgianus]
MEAPTLAGKGDLCCPRSSSPEGETVCAALARYENTLRDAIREIHVDVSAFKLGMECRLEETANLSGPLGRAVAQLQQENRQLRSQLEALTLQVELLSGMTCDRSTALNGHNHSSNHKNLLSDIQENHQEVKEVIYGKGEALLHVQPCVLGGQAQTHSGLSSQASTPSTFLSSPISSSPPVGSRVSSMVTGPVSSSSPSTARFSSRATFAVSSKTNSIEREEPIEVDPTPTHAGLENGHAATTEPLELLHGKVSPPNNFPHEHTAPVAMRMPHLPVTATTKTAEMKGPDSPSSPSASRSSPVSDDSPTGQSAASTNRIQPIEEFPIQPVSSSWTPTPIRALGSPRLQEKANSVLAKSVTYSGLVQHDRDDDVDDVSSDRSFGQVGERRRELVRSQTLPRNIGAQARRSIFERLDSEANNSHPKPVDSKPKLKRSQSFGVSSASSIKQILLEWCRSKTIGYQNIEIQNFSSSWSDGMAFCALVHSFFPTEFDYTSLLPANRKHNFELAFGTAELKAGCDRLIEVDDMMIMGRKPDPMCVFTYVQSLYNHLRKFE